MPLSLVRFWPAPILCWQMLRTSASVRVYNPATDRRAPAAPRRPVRNPLRLGRLQRIPQTSPLLGVGQVAVGEGVTACSQQRCA